MTRVNAAPHLDDPWRLEAAEVARALGTDASAGLGHAEAAARLASVGPNRLVEAGRVPAWRRLLAQYRDPLVYLLLGAIGVSAAAWALEGGGGLPVEAIVIGAIVLVNGVLGYVQEAQAQRAVEALRRMAAPTASVLRGGEPARVPADEIVPGDVMLLATGDAVSADGRLVSTESLVVTEASLTGESEPIVKQVGVLPGPTVLADRRNMVFAGTAVTAGHAVAVATATGMRTQVGRIAALLDRTPEARTPLQREIARLGRVLGVAVVAVGLLVVVAVLLTSRVEGARALVDVLLLGVSIAVAAVPEGLPAILTVILAIGVQRMARKRAIVKRLSSVETLGSATVICSDKTGTLTRNEMTIRRIVTRSGEVSVTGVGFDLEGTFVAGGRPLERGALRSEVRAVLGAGCLASDALLPTAGGISAAAGDPTDVAFLVAEHKLGTAERRAARFSRRGEIPFSPERRMMSSIEADAEREGELALMAKGAPDVLLALCTRERIGVADEPLGNERRRRILDEVDRLAGEGMRTLGVAYRQLHVTGSPGPGEGLESDLVFAGLVGMVDPPRPEVRAAIREAHEAGIRVVMITGDHPRTAAAVAREVGILPEGSPERSIVTGAQLDSLGPDELARAARGASVYARVAPEHKLRIIDALRAEGNVVAMTGDGVNDAPALRSADIGVAMGVAGTDVSKEAASMILADDNFATIVAAVREGRAIFANIRRGLRYLLSSNAGEVLTVFGGVVGASLIGLDAVGAAVAAPLLATQILWINLLTDSAPALAMGFEPAPSDVMRRPPRRASDRVIDRGMWVDVSFIGLVMALATLAALDLGLPGGLLPGSGTLSEARTMAFTVLVLAQVFNAFGARSDRDSAFVGVAANPRLLVAAGMSIGLQLLVVHVGFLNLAFGTTPMSLAGWVTCTLLASTVLWASELRKLVVRYT